MLVLNGELYEPDVVCKSGSKWIEFAYCGDNKIPVARIFHKTKSFFKTLTFTGKRAQIEKERFLKRVEYKKNNITHGTYSNQNVYYGDFKKTRKKDKNGLPIYLMQRKNFNNQSETLYTIQTKLSIM